MILSPPAWPWPGLTHVASPPRLPPALLQLLVEQGRANVLVRDRFNNLPIDDARRLGAQAVVDYLDEHMPMAERCVLG